MDFQTPLHMFLKAFVFESLEPNSIVQSTWGNIHRFLFQVPLFMLDSKIYFILFKERDTCNKLINMYESPRTSRLLYSVHLFGVNSSRVVLQ